MPRAMKERSAKRRLNSSPVGDRYCDTCNKEFSRPSELKRHFANTLIHNPTARRFQCKYCGSLHTQKSNLKIHERIHLNEQKEICKLPLDASWHKRCDFKCSDPSSMIRHIGTVHVSPYINHDYGHPILPQWLIQAMKERAEAKGVRHSAESAGPRTPSPFPSSTALGSAPHASLSESPTFDASTQSKAHIPDTGSHISHPVSPNLSGYPLEHQPISQHFDPSFGLPDFIVAQAELPASSSPVFLRASGTPYLDSDLDSDLSLSLSYEQPQAQIDQQNFADPPLLAATIPSESVFSDFDLLNIDPSIIFSGVDAVLPFLSPAMQVQMELHGFA